MQNKNEKETQEVLSEPIEPQLPQFNQTANTTPPKRSKRIGSLVAGIICTLLGIGFTIWAIYNSIDPFVQGDDYSMLAFVLFMIVGGALIFLPALGFTIAGVTCSSIGIKSCNKHIKAWCIFFLVLSVITLIIIIVAPFVIPYIVQSAQPTT